MKSPKITAMEHLLDLKKQFDDITLQIRKLDNATEVYDEHSYDELVFTRSSLFHEFVEKHNTSGMGKARLRMEKYLDANDNYVQIANGVIL